MIQTIRVRTIIGPDLVGNGVLHDIRHILGNYSVEKVETAKVYRLEGASQEDAKKLAETLFSEKINQTYALNSPIIKDAKDVVEIAYKPGVMNPEVASIMKAAEDLGIELVAADSSREYGFYGRVTEKQIKEIIRRLNLLNETVEHIVTKSPDTLVIHGKAGSTKTIPIRNMSNKQLEKLSQDTLFLNLDEMHVIQNYFQQEAKRDPTDVELETLAQTWSEHSGHKTFKAKLFVDGKEKEPLFNRIKQEALKHNKHIVSAFVDNAGVMDFYDGWAISGKGETHNSPAAIEPYGGAMTGSGGVFRDILGTGQGGKPIVSTDIFCFAPLDLDPKELPEGTLPPLYLLKRVVAGVADYGNRIGIPTNNGSVHFHKDFRARPTVLVGSYGILPKEKAPIGKAKVGDLVVVVGGRTGRDGIHGATFASGEMTHKTVDVNASAVQIGNAIEEKRMLDALLEARDRNLIRAMQDVGGGGFSSAIGEMGKDTGVTVHLEKAPVKYSGLAPWEIWLSESQERMVIVLSKTNLKKFEEIMKKYNVEVSVLGKFDGSKKLTVVFDKKIVAQLSMEFLHNGLPQRVMIARQPVLAGPVTRYPHPMSSVANRSLRALDGGPPRVSPAAGSSGQSPRLPKTEKEWINNLEKVVAHGNVNSKEPIVRLYDHSVMGTNAMQPYSGVKLDGPNDAVVMKPFLDKQYGMIVSHGLNPILNRIDPYWGSIWAAAEAIANYVAVGGDYKEASVINNYVWPFPDEESLWSLDRSVDAVVDFMKTLGIPVISGKDSLSSTYRGKDGLVIKIPPVLCISVFGRIPDVDKTVSSDLKQSDSLLYLVGAIDEQGLSGSTYFDVHKILGDSIPKVNLSLLPQVLDTLHTAIQSGEVLSSHDVSEGGIITAIFEMCVGGDMGASLNVIASIAAQSRPDYFLFNETAGTFVVEVKDKATAEKLFEKVPYMLLGETKKERVITVNEKKLSEAKSASGGKKLFDVDVEQLKEAWQKPMKEIFS